MDTKKVLVMDTNFIIEHLSELHNVHQKLSETYYVFVSEISIQERLSQKYIELRKKYEELEKIIKEYSTIAKIEKKYLFEVKFESKRELIKKSYSDLFGDNIVPFEPNADMLKTIMDRVYKKIPPFINADGASDKGFKDTLLWLSLLEYFKNCEGGNVIFVTDDKGFRNNSDALCSEFNEYTGKTIEIQGNNFYNTLIEKSELSTEIVLTPLPDISILRDKIQEVVSSLCYGAYDEDSWGEPIWQRTFTLHERLTADDLKNVFDNLRKVIAANIFENNLTVETAFPLNSIKNEFPVPMNALQNALSLYEDICSNFRDYLPQFFSAAANIFNRNYQEIQPISEFDIPF